MNDFNSKFIRAVKMPDEPYQFTLCDKLSNWLEDRWPIGRYLYVESFEEYLLTPYFKKTVWGIFYKEVILRKCGNGLLAYFSEQNKKDSEIIEAYIKFRWPVQYWIREHVNFSWRSLKDMWYQKIDARIHPRQKWLTDSIPNTWMDKVSLIPDVNFLMVTHFVESEECFGNTDYEASSEALAGFANELRDCYDYIKNRRPALQKDYENSFPTPGEGTGDYETDYAENNRLEKLMSELDTKYLVWIVTNRDYFWT